MGIGISKDILAMEYALKKSIIKWREVEIVINAIIGNRLSLELK